MKKLYYALAFLLLATGMANAQLVVFADDYAAGVNFVPFGGSTNNLTVDATNARPGSPPGSKALKVDVPGGGYTGGAMVAAAPQNATAFNALSFWVKASKAATLNVAGIGNNAAGSSLATELNSPIALTTEWQRVIIPVPDASKLTAFNGLWHFAEGADEGVYTIWFDDIQYENIGGGAIGAPSAAAMAMQNLTVPIGGKILANGVTATIPVNAVPVALRVGSAFPTYTSNPVGRITFNADGEGTAQTSGAAVVTATLAGTALTGTITVTVSSAPTGPTTPAPPPPGRSPSDVVSLFSEAFTSAATLNLADFTPPGNTTRVVNVGGDDALELTIVPSGPFHGFNLSNAVDLSEMTFLHYDIWIAGNTQVGAVFNSTVSQHGGGHLTGQTVGYVQTNPIAQGQEGKWLSFDLAFSSFAPNLQTGLKNIISQIVFTHINSSAGGPIYMDNIYFYKPGPLPVTLSSFTAVKREKAVVLNWQTTTEVNNRGFEVQRSTNGERWVSLQFVDGQGNSNIKQDYSLEDANPTEGLNYYRLKQIDYDGRFSFSSVKVVNWNSNLQFSVYPNPARGQVMVSMANTTGALSYTILDLQGKRVSTGIAPVTNGTGTLQVGNLPAGTYVLQLNNGKITLTSKLQVQ